MESTRSRPHRQAEKYLDNLFVNYVSECSDFPPYSPDLYLPEMHVCVEIDGPGHLAKKDTERDKFLEERYFLPTLRIKTKGLNSVNFTKVLIPFLEKWAGTAEVRKYQMRQTSARSNLR